MHPANIDLALHPSSTRASSQHTKPHVGGGKGEEEEVEKKDEKEEE